MMKKPNPRVLIGVLVLGAAVSMVSIFAAGSAATLLYTQKQMSEIVMNSQASEARHKLEIDNVKLQDAKEWQAKVDEASGNDKEQTKSIADMKKTTEKLASALANLSKKSDGRAQVGDKIAQKVDDLAAKMDQVAIQTTPKPRKKRSITP